MVIDVKDSNANTLFKVRMLNLRGKVNSLNKLNLIPLDQASLKPLMIIKFGTIDQNESCGCCETRIKVGDYSLLEQDGKVFPSRRILEPKSHLCQCWGLISICYV